MTETSPWENIAIPNTDFNVRRVAGKTGTPCFWGRDADGNCLFIVELQGDHTAQYRKRSLSINGINIDLRGGAEGKQRLVLALERQTDRDLFTGLCRTLAFSLEHASDSASSLAISLAHVRRWKNFLSGNSQYLSPEEVRGLFAEITFLLELIDKDIPSSIVVDAWLGPEKSHQDFIFGNTSVEIKSLSGAERNSVRISSEDQLESLNDSLFLRIYRLSSLFNAPNAHSLNQIISTVYSRIDNADAIEKFERKLTTHGYAPFPSYDQPRFVISGICSYRVNDDFPRLTRSQLPTGVANVAYNIRLETIAPFECDGAIVFEGL